MNLDLNTIGIIAGIIGTIFTGISLFIKSNNVTTNNFNQSTIINNQVENRVYITTPSKYNNSLFNDPILLFIAAIIIIVGAIDFITTNLSFFITIYIIMQVICIFFLYIKYISESIYLTKSNILLFTISNLIYLISVLFILYPVFPVGNIDYGKSVILNNIFNHYSLDYYLFLGLQYVGILLGILASSFLVYDITFKEYSLESKRFFYYFLISIFVFLSESGAIYHVLSLL